MANMTDEAPEENAYRIYFNISRTSLQAALLLKKPTKTVNTTSEVKSI